MMSDSIGKLLGTKAFSGIETLAFYMGIEVECRRNHIYTRKFIREVHRSLHLKNMTLYAYPDTWTEVYFLSQR